MYLCQESRWSWNAAYQVCSPGLAVSAFTQLQNCLGLLVFHLLRLAALTDVGRALGLVGLCDILTFLVALLILFFSFSWLMNEGKCEAVCNWGGSCGRREVCSGIALCFFIGALGILEVGLLFSN